MRVANKVYQGQVSFQRIEPQEVVIELYNGQVRKYRLESVTDPWRMRTVNAELETYWKEQQVETTQ